MTITTTTTRNRYTGNAATTVFPYSFRILAAADLVVTKRLATTLVETTLAYPADYSVSGVGNATGGSITLTVAPATGDLLVIERDTSRTQGTSIRNQGSYFPETHETVFDKLTMMAQEDASSLARTFALPKTLDPASYDMELPVPVSGQVLVWSPTGLTNGSVSSGNVVLPGQGRDTTTLTQYLANNYVYNVLDYDADPTGAVDSITDFQAANTAANGAGIVYIPAGTFLVSGSVTVISGNQYIGTGYLSYVKSTTDAPIFTGSSKSNVVIADLRLDGQQTGSGLGNWALINLDFSPTNVTVRNCWLLNARQNAINLHQPFDCVIQENYVSGSAGHGIWLRTSLGTQPTNNKVIGNTIVNAGTNPVSGQGDGILIDSANDFFYYVIVANNIVRNSFRLGIELFGSGHGSKYVSVTGNVVEHVSATGAQYGISIASCQFGAITGNTIRGGVIGLEGATASDCTFTGNTIDGASSLGISISGTCTDTVVNGNVVSGTTDHGIEVNGTAGVTRMSVIGNVVRGSTTRGIFLNSLGAAGNFTCNSNVVTGCGKSGIFVFESDGGTVANNVATGNNTTAAGGENDIVISLSGPRSADKVTTNGNIVGSAGLIYYPGLTPTLAYAPAVASPVGLFKKFTAAVTNVATNFAHGLGRAPVVVLLKSKGNVTVWESGTADGTNVNLQASAAGPTNVDVYVA